MNAKKTFVILLFLSAVFFLRVVSQIVAAFVELPLLPTFEEWHSGSMPYPLLLFFQIVILFVLLRTALKVSTHSLIPRKKLGKSLVVISIIYFVTMAARMVLGVTIYTDVRFFTNFITPFFHFVLAAYVIVLGLHYLKMSGGSRNAVKKTII